MNGTRWYVDEGEWEMKRWNDDPRSYGLPRDQYCRATSAEHAVSIMQTRVRRRVLVQRLRRVKRMVSSGWSIPAARFAVGL